LRQLVRPARRVTVGGLDRLGPAADDRHQLVDIGYEVVDYPPARPVGSRLDGLAF